jgi:hypothetical protein
MILSLWDNVGAASSVVAAVWDSRNLPAKWLAIRNKGTSMHFDFWLQLP